MRERLVGPELDHRPSHVAVGVEDVDVGRADAVGLPRQSTREVVLFHGGVEKDLLARLDVRADADDEFRIALKAFVHRPRSYVDRSIRLPACAS